VGSESYTINRKFIFNHFVLGLYVPKIATRDTLVQVAPIFGPIQIESNR